MLARNSDLYLLAMASFLGPLFYLCPGLLQVDVRLFNIPPLLIQGLVLLLKLFVGCLKLFVLGLKPFFGLLQCPALLLELFICSPEFLLLGLELFSLALVWSSGPPVTDRGPWQNALQWRSSRMPPPERNDDLWKRISKNLTR